MVFTIQPSIKNIKHNNKTRYKKTIKRTGKARYQESKLV